MPSISVRDAFAPLTADATADGWAPILAANMAGFYPGAICYISAPTVAGTRCRITDLDLTGNRVRLRPILAANGSTSYTWTTLAAYTLALNSTIYQEAGVVRLLAPSTVVKADHTD